MKSFTRCIKYKWTTEEINWRWADDHRKVGKTHITDDNMSRMETSRQDKNHTRKVYRSLGCLITSSDIFITALARQHRTVNVFSPKWPPLVHLQQPGLETPSVLIARSLNVPIYSTVVNEIWISRLSRTYCRSRVTCGGTQETAAGVSRAIIFIRHLRHKIGHHGAAGGVKWSSSGPPFSVQIVVSCGLGFVRRVRWANETLFSWGDTQHFTSLIATYIYVYRRRLGNAFAPGAGWRQVAPRLGPKNLAALQQHRETRSCCFEGCRNIIALMSCLTSWV